MNIYLYVFPALSWLDVSGSWASDPFPADFSKFPNLQYLLADRGTQQFGWGGFPTSLDGLRELVFLSLADSGLEGGIPDEVGNLTQLVSLDLSDNFLNGSIPNLERCTRLTHISLTNNSFSGEAPAAPNLQYLDAAQNRFTDFPRLLNLFHMSSLQRVDLSRNQLGGQLLAFTGLNFPSLHVLNLSWNGLHGQIPGTLTPLRLDLSHNFLSGPIPWDFHPPGGKMHWVDLSGNQLNGSIPRNFLAGTHFVNLSGNSLVGSIPDITLDVFVQVLDLSGNQLNGPLPSSFTTVGIDILCLQNNQLLGDLISLLPHWSGNTYSVRLQGNRFTGDLTNLLDLMTMGILVLDLCYNNLTMMPSKKFPNPLQGMLEFVCNSDYEVPDSPWPGELRLAGTDLMGIPLPDRLNCSDPIDPLLLQILDVAPCNLGGTVTEGLFNISIPNNKLSGPIPDGFQHPTLQVLDLSRNNLTGEIPGKLFFGLPNLRYLNLTGNKLRGPIPDVMPQALYDASFFAGALRRTSCALQTTWTRC